MANSNTTKSYLDPPQLHGKMNSDGTYTLSALEMKAQSDFNYRVAKMIQGELNLKNLNADTNAVVNGKVSFVDLSTGGSTIINGGNITTGTISADRVSGGTLEGVTVISVGANLAAIKLSNGYVILEKDNDTKGSLSYNYLEDKNELVSYGGVPLKILSSSNMSIDSNGTIYIGTSAGLSGDVDIGKTGGNINLIGNVSVNGTPL